MSDGLDDFFDEFVLEFSCGALLSCLYSGHKLSGRLIDGLLSYLSRTATVGVAVCFAAFSGFHVHISHLAKLTLVDSLALIVDLFYHIPTSKCLSLKDHASWIFAL